MLRAGVAAAALVLLAALVAAEEGTLPVSGKVVMPDNSRMDQVEVWLQLDSGRRLVAFPLPDGAFAFAGVPLGVHTLSVSHIPLAFPTVKLDVGAARKGKIAATVPEMPGAVLPYPLLLRPAAILDVFEKRQAFSVMGFLKTPYGMMAAFAAFSLFVLPMMKLDPEEMKELQGMRGGGGQEQQAAPPRVTGGGGRRRND